ncbi:MAG: hypothetical protein A2W93_05240 [Bacteroidetes bacterium GWF2_43_63]|nr:MAG: hypothetical protein A2W94_11910 [Bacteroidetes bacterium GWE2_42_42]OFY56279.1 MAG: hypothetical protein A2W93_05240 [Bacteroidetes bacterium GWF2_43_63]HBG71957.1 hypothetical protein [Bacteroidales bacterium]HCB61858.1 hypothetical protein [Bacteroidales bacterium]HCY23880.1 hypothetical protein [Bacteroidales bacterium]
MKDNLEKFISQNRPRFDDEDPSPALWDRIESSVPAPARVVRMRPLTYAASIAAACLIVWIVATLVLKPRTLDAEKILSLDKLKPELQRKPQTDTVFVPVLVNPSAIASNNSVVNTPDDNIYAEITRYYDSEIAKRKAKLQSVSLEDENVMSQVQEELAMIDTLNAQTRRELGNGMNVGMVMEQLVQNYRQSIDILDMMLEQVNEEYAQINE